MTTSSSNSQPSSNSDWLRIWIEALAAVGGFASILALRTHLLMAVGAESAGSFCHISAKFDCEAVIGSKWSSFLGVSLASYGLVFYISLFFLAIVSGTNRLVSNQTAGRLFFLAGIISSIGSVALFIVSEVSIGALCLMCITMYLVNFLIFLRSWNLADQEPIFNRLKGAVFSVLRFPGLLVGIGNKGSVASWIAAWASVLIGIPIAYIIFFPPIYLFARPASGPSKTTQVSIASKLDGSAFGDYYKGSLSAPIEIVEFADFECPGCRRMYVFLEDFLKAYEGKYRLVFRNYPLDNKCNPNIPRQFHKYACMAAMYARCGGEQGKFWETLDYLFLAPEFEEHEVGADVEELLIENGTKNLGLDGVALRECLKSSRHLPKIQEDIAEAQRVGLQFTPSIWINGRFFNPVSPENLKKMLDEELQRSAKRLGR